MATYVLIVSLAILAGLALRFALHVIRGRIAIRYFQGTLIIVAGQPRGRKPAYRVRPMSEDRR